MLGGASWRRLEAILLAAIVTLSLTALQALPAFAVDVSPFERLVGRWVGEGRLGVRDNPTETVKCRVTYLHVPDGDQLRQTIRCASGGGSIEVQSIVSHISGTLAGILEGADPRHERGGQRERHAEGLPGGGQG